MKKLFHYMVHPHLILLSVFFWAAVVVTIYGCVIVYYFGKIFFSHDKTLKADEAVATAAILKINNKIYRCKVRPFVSKNRPFCKL